MAHRSCILFIIVLFIFASISSAQRQSLPELSQSDDTTGSITLETAQMYSGTVFLNGTRVSSSQWTDGSQWYTFQKPFANICMAR
ncbi:MAG: hypothetical protein WCW35_15435 [Bacteroidota bacterium]